MFDPLFPVVRYSSLLLQKAYVASKSDDKFTSAFYLDVTHTHAQARAIYLSIYLSICLFDILFTLSLSLLLTFLTL